MRHFATHPPHLFHPAALHKARILNALQQNTPQNSATSVNDKCAIYKALKKEHFGVSHHIQQTKGKQSMVTW
jgi:hypothetical protein